MLKGKKDTNVRGLVVQSPSLVRKNNLMLVPSGKVKTSPLASPIEERLSTENSVDSTKHAQNKKYLVDRSRSVSPTNVCILFFIFIRAFYSNQK
jgi:hypothetical protein